MHIAKMRFAHLFYINLFISATYAQNVSNYVYRITDKDMNMKGSMTGFQFRYQQYTGIVTCLHGIVPGRFYTAEGEESGRPNLTLKFVDIEHDMAFLTANYLRDKKEGIIAANAALIAGTSLKVLGYPAGTAGIMDHSAVAGRPVKKILKLMAPLDMIAFLHNRKSPSLNTDVLYIEGSMVAGHSGAPVLDAANDRVYGVVDGGIFNGAAGITWAIPINSIKWTDISEAGVADKINKLQQQSGKNGGLYDFGDDKVDDLSKHIFEEEEYAKGARIDLHGRILTDKAFDTTETELAVLMRFVTESDPMRGLSFYKDPKALEAADIIIEKYPYYPYGYAGKAVCLDYRGQEKEGLIYAKKAIEILKKDLNIPGHDNYHRGLLDELNRAFRLQ